MGPDGHTRRALERERARRLLAEKSARALREELDHARAFLEVLVDSGSLPIEMTVAVQDFLLSSPTIAAGKKKRKRN